MNPYAVISGMRQEGRHRALLAVIEQLRADGLVVGGVRHLSQEVDGEVVGWDAVRVADGSCLPMARPGPKPLVCNWEFRPGIFQECHEWIVAPGLDVVVVEVGRVEMGGGGHRPALGAALEAQARLVLISVRPRLLAPLVLGLDADPAAALELPAPESGVAAFVTDIKAVLP